MKSHEDFFDFSNLDESHEVLRIKVKKAVDEFKIETPKYIWIDEFIWLGSKAFCFKCSDKNTNKLKGFSKSQSKQFEFEECKKCLDGED